MEDAHAFVYDYGGVHGQGYFSIFDGHAGKHAAEWCGKHFHEYLIDTVVAKGASQPVPDLLNLTFHNVDDTLGKLATSQGTSSGCTAVTCFLRLEDEEGKPLAHNKTGGINKSFAKRLSGVGGAALTTSRSNESDSPPSGEKLNSVSAQTTEPTSTSPSKSSGGGGLLSSFAKRIRKASSDRAIGEDQETKSSNGERSAQEISASASASSGPNANKGTLQSGEAPATSDSSGPPASLDEDDGLSRVSAAKVRRVLYTANVGDARAVLCRKGHAIRLTYDHKASDAQEVKRITDAGGFVMNNRVNAVLAVTRSLGDSAMKEFVVGAPYTTETTLTDDDTFLIVACDGLWDVTDDQDAVDLIANLEDPQEAAQTLLQHALSNFSTDNTSVMVVRFNADGTTPASKAPKAGEASSGSGSGSSDETSAASSVSQALGGLGSGLGAGTETQR